MNSLGTSQYKDELVIVHKRTYDFASDGQPITHALFTVFSSSSTVSHPDPPQNSSDLSPSRASNTASRALVVVLKTLMHIIYLDGGSYIVHLPFPVLKIWSIPLGILLERQVDTFQDPSSPTDLSLSESDHQLLISGSKRGFPFLLLPG
jgi:hypothetical protein